MKKHFLMLLILLCAFEAQAKYPVLKFCGIPIEGTTAVFGSKLPAKGFKFKQSDGDLRLYQGRFLKNEAEVLVFAQNKSHLVEMLSVTLNYTYLTSIDTEYKNIVRMYYRKYVEMRDTSLYSITFSDDEHISVIRYKDKPIIGIQANQKTFHEHYGWTVTIMYFNRDNYELSNKENDDEI